MLSPVSVPFVVERLVGLRDQALLLLGRVQVHDLVGELAVLDHAVGRRHEAVLGDLARSSSSEPIRPMFGPSGVSIGHIRP